MHSFDAQQFSKDLSSTTKVYDNVIAKNNAKSLLANDNKGEMFSSMLSKFTSKLKDNTKAHTQVREMSARSVDLANKQKEALKELRDKEEDKKAEERKRDLREADMHRAEQDKDASLIAQAEQDQKAQLQSEDFKANSDSSANSIVASFSSFSTLSLSGTATSLNQGSSAQINTQNNQSNSQSFGQGQEQNGADARAIAQAKSSIVAASQHDFGTNASAFAKGEGSANATLSMASVASTTNSNEDLGISQELNALNHKNLSSVGEGKTISESERLANMNTQDLRTNLDRLAKEANVGKLSVEIANPQTLATQRKDEAKLSQLPSSQQDSVAKLGVKGGTNVSPSTASNTSPNSAPNNVLKSANTTNNGVEQGQAQSQSLTKAQTQTNTTTKPAYEHLSTEDFIKQRQDKQTSHGLLETKNNQSKAQSNLAQNSNVNQGASSKGIGSAQAALLEMARHSGTSTNGANGVLNSFVSQQALADETTLANATKPASQSLAQAITSLQQGLKMGDSSASSDNPLSSTSIKSVLQESSSSIANSIFAVDDNLASSAESDFNQAQSDADEKSQSEHDNSFAFMQSGQLNQSTSTHSQTELKSLQHFNFHSAQDTQERAKEIHEKVMAMAARNMKHLSVELTPPHLGKIKLAIDLNQDNDAVSVSIATFNPETKALLEQAMPSLRNTLAQQGIETEATVQNLADDSNLDANDNGSFAQDNRGFAKEMQEFQMLKS